MVISRSKLSPSKKNLAKYMEVLGYSKPYPCVCDAEFVEYVQKKTDKTVSQALKDLLGGPVQIFSTMCISLNIKGMFGEAGHHRCATIQPCDHEVWRPELDSHLCMRTFVTNYLSRKLIICSMHKEDNEFYLSVSGRVLVIPDAELRGGITIAPLPKISFRDPPPEFSIMDKYITYYSLKSPLVTFCEPDFVRHVQLNLERGLTLSLESLLGGRIKLISTRCVYKQMKLLRLDVSEYKEENILECGHNEEDFAVCMRSFANDYPETGLVVCTVEEKERELYALDPSIIVVCPNERRGVAIDTHPTETFYKWTQLDKQVRRVHSQLYWYLRRYCLNLDVSSKKIQRDLRPLLVMVSTEDGEIFGPFSTVPQIAQKMLQITGANPLATDTLCFALSTSMRELNPYVYVHLGKTKRNERKRKMRSLQVDDSAAEPENQKLKLKRVEDPPTSRKAGQTPNTPLAAGPKTIFMANLKYSIEEKDIVHFFKDTGVVLDVRLAMRDGHPAGFGHVDFTTTQAAQKAIDLDGSLLLGRVVKIEYARKRRGIAAGFVRSGTKPGRPENLGYKATGSEKVEGVYRKRARSLQVTEMDLNYSAEPAPKKSKYESSEIMEFPVSEGKKKKKKKDVGLEVLPAGSEGKKKKMKKSSKLLAVDEAYLA